MQIYKIEPPLPKRTIEWASFWYVKNGSLNLPKESIIISLHEPSNSNPLLIRARYG